MECMEFLVKLLKVYEQAKYFILKKWLNDLVFSKLMICLHFFVGMDVVYKIESFGSRSGRTSKKIIIDDCGEVD